MVSWCHGFHGFMGFMVSTVSWCHGFHFFHWLRGFNGFMVSRVLWPSKEIEADVEFLVFFSFCPSHTEDMYIMKTLSRNNLTWIKRRILLTFHC